MKRAAKVLPSIATTLLSSLLIAQSSLTRLPMSPTASLYPLSSVRLLSGPFSAAAAANSAYMLALDPDRLLAPFRREAGLTPRKPAYGNWESIGLDGHTAGHYLSALASMIAAGHDTKQHEFRHRLDKMVEELAVCQDASPDGYVGGVPGSRELWRNVAAGNVAVVWKSWVPWYNLHKTFAGLYDAYHVAGNAKARTVLIRLADWAEKVTSQLSDAQMQQMLDQEHGGMAEAFADVYSVTHEKKYLRLAERFSHRAILDPLERGEDRLTGLHANTQIPKVIGFEKVANLTGNGKEDAAARFFWEQVTTRRSVAFGGNSVSEHFNDPKDFRGMLENREGPETCNTYNMLRLTEALFATRQEARYADFYERALYNHILASMNTTHPGFVYFTPIRPGHYRVYSQPEQGFWCCVGTGMENPGRYGQFIYARSNDGVFVNLFLPSELTDSERGLRLRQETKFPDAEHTNLSMRLVKPIRFTLHIRHPAWVAKGAFAVMVNGRRVKINSAPSSFAAISRVWKSGDRMEVMLPMRTTVERLPDGSDWVSILRGPIVLASAEGTKDQTGLLAGAGRGDHIAHGPLTPIDHLPALLSSIDRLSDEVKPDPRRGRMHFRISAGIATDRPEGIALQPFFRLEESRYQIVWDLTTKEKQARNLARRGEEERIKLARDVATLDRVVVGEQQPEVDHRMEGEGLEAGMYNGRRWRHGKRVQYTLDLKGATAAELEVTYSGDDSGRTFDIYANEVLLATQALKGERPGAFFEVRYRIAASAIAAAVDGKVTVQFVVKQNLAGGLYDVRLLKMN